MSDERTGDQLTSVDPISSPFQNYLVVQHLVRMPSLFARGLIYLILLLIVLSVAFSSIVKIDVFVSGQAMIKSDAHATMMYPTDAGIIRAIYVKQWQRVEEGTRLYLLETSSEENDNVQLVVIKAPIAGSITTVLADSIGEWVTERTPLCVAMPESVTFSVTISVENDDIGKIESGMPVVYKIDAFPYSEYGVLRGQVDSISPTTVQSNSGLAMYEVIGTLDHLFYQINDKKYPLREGMTGTAEFNTGSRPLLSIIFRTTKS